MTEHHKLQQRITDVYAHPVLGRPGEGGVGGAWWRMPLKPIVAGFFGSYRGC